MLVILLAAAAIAHPAPAWTSCSGKASVQPHSIVLACADGNFYADHLHWTSWNAKSATATGIGHQNDCKPYCAAGHFHAYKISIRLSKVVTCHGRREFARIGWRWTEPTPKLKGVPRHGSETLPCTP